MPLAVDVMASPKVPSRYVLPADHEESPVQIRAAEAHAKRMGKLLDKQLPPIRNCRHCGTMLATGAEWRLGIHIWCVYHIKQSAVAAAIPRPRYGRH